MVKKTFGVFVEEVLIFGGQFSVRGYASLGRVVVIKGVFSFGEGSCGCG